MLTIGIDVGFGFTKATNGREYVIFKSIIGDATDIQFQSTFGDNTFSKNLHVTFNNQSYFIGSLAEQQSTYQKYTLSQDKMVSEFIKIFSLVAAGICFEEGSPLNIISGLPIDYLKKDYKKVSQQLIGHHKITYHWSDHSSFTRKMYINKIQMIPQPMGSFFNLLMNDTGKIIDTDLRHKKVGILDIGFRTTDAIIVNRLKYLERGSISIDMGISNAFTLIASQLRKDHGIHIELFRLHDAVRKNVIKIRGKEFNISGIIDNAYDLISKYIADTINRLWDNEWDIDTIILTGGGSIALEKHLKSHIIGNVIISIVNSIDPRLSNVQGYFKYGIYKWNNSASDKQPDADNKAITANTADFSDNQMTTKEQGFFVSEKIPNEAEDSVDKAKERKLHKA